MIMVLMMVIMVMTVVVDGDNDDHFIYYSCIHLCLFRMLAHLFDAYRYCQDLSTGMNDSNWRSLMMMMMVERMMIKVVLVMTLVDL